MSIDLEALSQKIAKKKQSSHSPFVIAIDGRSGVGKSTLAPQITDRDKTVIVTGDDFYAGGVIVHSKSPRQLVEICIDRHQKLTTVLTTLKNGNPATYHAFDWNKFDGSLSEIATTLEPKEFVVIEGVYSNHPDLCQLIDFSILVVLEEQERLRRFLKREGQISDWEKQWHRAEQWYFNNLATEDAFDLVVDNI